MSSLFKFSHAFVRPLSSSYEKALSMNPPSSPIDHTLALAQHEAYVDLLRTLLPSVIEVPSSDLHPDCCFIEDTAEFIKKQGEESRGLMVINRLGAPSRQGEELGVLETLRLLSESRPSIRIAELASGNIDGGDVLFTGDCVLIGDSSRTNQEGIECLRTLLSPLNVPVFSIPIKAGLHLKSCCTLIDDGVVLIADTETGRQIRSKIESLPVPFEFVVVPDEPASNVLRINNNIVIQEGYPDSEPIVTAFAESRGFTIHKLQMSEFTKADGCLTCCSILVDF